jgi:hypothetical protein
MKKSLFVFMFFFVAIFTIAQTVYVTETGSKYHSDGCRYLSRSCIATSLSEAKSEGYAPCSVCSPPTQVYKKHITSKKKRSVSKKRNHKRHYSSYKLS